MFRGIPPTGRHQLASDDPPHPSVSTSNANPIGRVNNHIQATQNLVSAARSANCIKFFEALSQGGNINFCDEECRTVMMKLLLGDKEKIKKAITMVFFLWQSPAQSHNDPHWINFSYREALLHKRG